ncbi:T9SS type A sorting domain-containing protein [uncultured Maribacter sp.]|uniref:T9SS type A sorting domain-containing protein n=1 Tax=uncultured Maribacter sp. TaxID=431308 RepID=UPI002638A530|nr:T9SS type A sorting domain-containing protein [uncultured Maribacter sp.]
MHHVLRILLFSLFLSISNIINAAGVNPFLVLSNNSAVCPTDGSITPELSLCYPGDMRIVQVSDPEVLSVQWQKLDENSCSPVGADCANLNPTCTWNTISTEASLSINSIGQYRVVLGYENDVFESFYAKVFENNITSSVLTVQPISSNGASDGIIEVFVSGNSGPYSYQLLDFNFNPIVAYQANPVFTNLPAGTYNISTINSYGCEVTSQISLTEPPILVGQLIQTQATSSCLDTGVITANASGGMPPYMYSINGGMTYVNTNVFSNLGIGNYTVNIRDASNIVISTNGVSVTSLEDIQSTYTVQNVTCYGESNGSITVETIGGSGQYQYQLSNGIDVLVPYQNSNVFNNLAVGSYEINVQDSLGCVLILPTIVITEPLALDTSVSVTSITGHGANDGIITITPSGGTPDYTFAISPNLNLFSTDNTFTGLAPGAYTIMVSDANGCIVNVTQEITEPEELMVTLEVPSILCGVAVDTQVKIIATGGSGNFLYAYNSLDIIDAQVDNIFMSITPGNHFISVFDASGYFKTVDFTVEESEGLSLNNEIAYDFETNKSSVKISVDGGEAPYYFSNDDVVYSTFPLFNGLINGEYIFYVKDKNDCKSSITVTIDFRDSESDGVLDRDEDVNNNGNLEDDDTDNDGIPNYLDSDDDGDGVSTIDEIDNIGTDKNKKSAKKVVYLDTDKDNIPNYIDSDDDGDGYLTIDEDYNNNGNPADDDINKSGVADYLEKEIHPESVTELDLKKEVVVFQNTGHTESINLLWKAVQKSETIIKIYNGKGNIVYSNNLKNGTYEAKLNVSQLSRGIYFIYIKNDDMEEIKKVLIQ